MIHHNQVHNKFGKNWIFEKLSDVSDWLSQDIVHEVPE